MPPPPRPATAARPATGSRSPPRSRAAWLAIHFGGIFAFPLTAATWPLAVPLVAAPDVAVDRAVHHRARLHARLVRARAAGVNRAVGRAMLMLYAGLDYDRMLPNHFAHHRHVGTAADPDFDAANPTRPGPWLVALLRALLFALADRADRRRAGGLSAASARSLLNILVFWAVPALLALVQLFYFGTFLPHRHAATRSPTATMRAARAFGPLVSVLTCFNFGGYHHEHHLHPHVPWWRLPATRAGDGRAHEARRRRSLALAARRAARRPAERITDRLEAAGVPGAAGAVHGQPARRAAEPRRRWRNSTAS